MGITRVYMISYMGHARHPRRRMACILIFALHLSYSFAWTHPWLGRERALPEIFWIALFFLERGSAERERFDSLGEEEMRQNRETDNFSGERYLRVRDCGSTFRERYIFHNYCLGFIFQLNDSEIGYVRDIGPWLQETDPSLLGHQRIFIKLPSKD